MSNLRDSQPAAGRVLVLGTDNRVVLAVVRSLGRQGLRVHVGWCDPAQVALRSRYVTAYHAIPPFSPYNLDWKTALIDVLREHEFDLVIPCNDSTVVPLHSCRDELRDLAHVYLLPSATHDIVSSKVKSHELAQKLGIPVPAGGLVATAEEAVTWFERFAPPLVLKPINTFTLENSQTSNVVRLVYTPSQMRQCLRLPAYRHGAQVQERFEGTGAGVELLCHDGNVLFAFQHLRLHETMEYGSSYRRSAPVDSRLLADATALMRELRYTGVAMVEFIIDRRSGRHAFLEINGRFWGSLPLAVAAGADFPFYLYQMLVKGRREFPRDYRTDVHCRNLLLDWQSRQRWLTGSMLRRGRELCKTAWQILTRDYLDNYAADDPRPGWAEVHTLLSRFGRRALQRLGLWRDALAEDAARWFLHPPMHSRSNHWMRRKPSC